MSGINYDLKKIKGVAFDVDGVLSPSTIPLQPDGNPLRMANIKDGYALKVAVNKGIRIAIISKADSEAVRNRFKALGIPDIYMGSMVKTRILESWMEKYGLKKEEVAYVGDDIPDYEAMKAVGLPMAPADAADDIREIAVYISKCRGGEGVGRDIMEQILRSKNCWETTSSD